MAPETICGPDQALVAAQRSCDGGLMEMEPRQCRAARGLLGMTQKELAQRAGISAVTLNQFEAGVTTPLRATLTVLQQALEKAGVEFTNDDEPGVKMRRKGKRK
jgi:DNA-binding XRE family transcriptional regulator